MQKTMAARIIGTGSYLPERVVTNHDLAQMFDTSDEWIQQRSGIKERRFAAESETPAELAFQAATKALESANLTSQDIDLVLVATLSPDAFFPGTACFLHEKLGLNTQPAMDIRCQCSGFIYALNIAKLFIESRQYHRVMVVGSELHSRALDFSNEGRDTAVLFGDGAGAVILEGSEDIERGILSCHLHAQGEHARKLWIRSPGLANDRAVTKQHVDDRWCYPYMDGRFVFKNAVQRMPEVLTEALRANHLQSTDIDLFLFHQANLRINEFICESMKLDPNRTYNNIQRYGNCSAASIPICLDECLAEGKINDGDLICMTSFGSGFTWASAVIRW